VLHAVEYWKPIIVLATVQLATQGGARRATQLSLWFIFPAMFVWQVNNDLLLIRFRYCYPECYQISDSERKLFYENEDSAAIYIDRHEERMLDMVDGYV
jgi:hypothetical protein